MRLTIQVEKTKELTVAKAALKKVCKEKAEKFRFAFSDAIVLGVNEKIKRMK